MNRGYVEIKNGTLMRGLIGRLQKKGADFIDADEIRLPVKARPETHGDGIYRAKFSPAHYSVFTAWVGAKLKGRSIPDALRVEGERLKVLGITPASSFRTDSPGVVGRIRQEALINEASEAKKAQSFALGRSLTKWAEETKR